FAFFRKQITLKRDVPEHFGLNNVQKYEKVSGLAYSHSLKIIHGDIKGANVLVNNRRSCRLADFGLATVADTQHMDSTTSTVKGTVRWMAPELFIGGGNAKMKWTTDIYAYACTVYEVVNGGRPPKPSNEWFPKGMWSMVEICWAREPSFRPCALQIKLYLSNLVLLESNASNFEDIMKLCAEVPGHTQFQNLKNASILM
ncbi:hypothetical protein MPER_04342, partial [Moniliophthora perniciosa FA553]